MKNQVRQMVIDFVGEYKNKNHTLTEWKEPLVGFADAENELFNKYREIIDEKHLLPIDILPGARTVVSYFIPFTENLVRTNYKGDAPSREWAVAYLETNKLLLNLGEYLIEKLDKIGAGANMARFDAPGFDTNKVISYWSQRHVAYAAGLGTFGLNNMLITNKGCCGRFGSIVIDIVIEPDSVLETERCLYKYNSTCKKCVEACPSKALTVNGFDRHKCYELLLEYDKMFSDLELTEVCGKCVAMIPCSFINPLKNK
ncbi:epoxyqueuosine reductase [Sedimentibacter sp. B4]|uniref:epoxyqueuosine reductase n=1 Tax=Sedimentibacter sp. B4 TaxID=304766 RepID=UPI0002FBECC9|nr:epoxyqueuosine reductase [Sedimentibacter sp. B4]